MYSKIPFFKRLITSLTLSCTLLSAENYEYADPTFNERFNAKEFFSFLCNYEFSGEFLLWTLCGTEIDWVANSQYSGNNIQVDYYAIDSQWTPGFRVGFKAPDVFHQFGLTLNYARLSDSKNFTLSTKSEFSHPIVHQAVWLAANSIFSQEATANSQFQYHEWNALFSTSHCFRDNQIQVEYFAGATGLVFNQTLNTTLLPESIYGPLTYNWKSKFTAAGLKLGAETNLRPGSCIQPFFSVSGMLLAGHNHGSTFIDYDSLEWLFKEPSYTYYFSPGMNLKAGFNGRCELCNFIFEATVAYEFVNYWNTPTVRTFTGWDNQWIYGCTTPPDYGHFGFHGLSCGINTHF